MADPVAALEIAEERKDDVRKLLQDAKKAASDKALDQIEQAKLDFRAGVAGSRRPEQFDPATMHITTYFDNFEPFRAIMNLDGAQAVNTFLTYVNQKALDTLVAQEIAYEKSWESFKKKAIEALKSPSEAVQARFELKKARQRVDETVAQFGERLMKLGRLGYTRNEFDAMESILKDSLSGGVLRDEVAIVLINRTGGDFKAYLEDAIKLDTAYRARATLKDEDNLHVSILKHELVPPTVGSQPITSSNTVLPRSVDSVSAQNDPSYAQFHTQNMDINNVSVPTHGIPQGMAQNPRTFLATQSGQPGPQPASNQYGHPVNPNLGTNVTCYLCFMQGHIASHCPNRPAGYSPRNNSNGQGRNRNVTCYYCGIQGHVIRDCRKKRREEGQMYYSQQQQQLQNQQPQYQGHGYSPRNPAHYASVQNGNQPGSYQNGSPHWSQHNSVDMGSQPAQSYPPASNAFPNSRNNYADPTLVARPVQPANHDRPAQSNRPSSQVPKN